MMSETFKYIFSVDTPERPNQDSASFFDRLNGDVVMSLADGVGGSSDGKLASQTVVDCVSQWVDSLDEQPSNLFIKADEKLKELVKSNPDKYATLSSTLTLALISGNLLKFAHVGDSRLYILRKNGLKTLTKDQTEVQQLIEQGILTKRRMKSYHRSHVLTSALGASNGFFVQTGEFTLESKDRVFLCTDGVYNLISKEDFVEISIGNNFTDFIESVKTKIVSIVPDDDATVIAYEHQ